MIYQPDSFSPLLAEGHVSNGIYTRTAVSTTIVDRGSSLMKAIPGNKDWRPPFGHNLYSTAWALAMKEVRLSIVVAKACTSAL